MEEETKTLTVTASNGVRVFSETAHPYNEAAHDDQYETCVDSIHNQMKKAGVHEARKSYRFEENIS